MVAELGKDPLGPQLLSTGSPSNCTFLPSILTFIEPGPTNLMGPWVLAETRPPPVALLAMSPVDAKLEPRTATGLPSIVTFLEKPLGEIPLRAMLGRGVGTNGAGGPGIL